MLPAARVSAAIEVLDKVLGGAAVEPCLTNWGRANRFAGSGDRAAIRDLVFDGLRCKRSYAALGGAATGRGLMIGHLRAQGQAPEAVFTGIGHAPAGLSDTEICQPATEHEALDCPDWLAPRLQDSLGKDFAAIMRAMQNRAPLFLRVNMARITREEAAKFLADDGIETVPHSLADSSLQAVGSTRKILTTSVYLEGLVELQDAASQAVVAALPVADGQKILDVCAGGGGKSLAIAALADVRVWAYDLVRARMRDLPARAARARAKIDILNDPLAEAPYDMVLVDAPCSGSGSWRRDPVGKWALTEVRLQELLTLQQDILDQAAKLVTADGKVAYVTCSLLADENAGQVTRFLGRHPDWTFLSDRQFTPLEGGDGFYLAVLSRKS